MLHAVTKYDDPEESTQAADVELPLDLLNGDTLPSGRKVVVVPMKGKVERAFFEAVQSKDPVTVSRGWSALILGVTPAVDGQPTTEDIIADMDEADRRTIMLMCRRRTYSDPKVTFTWKCAPPWVESKIGSCGQKTDSTVDITGMTYKPVPSSEQGVKLPRCGKMMTLLRPTGRTQEKYIALRRGRETTDHTQMMVAREVRLDGQVASMAELDDLIGEDRVVIKRALSSDYGPDSKIEGICKNCGATGKLILEMLPGFFFPGAEEK